MEKKEFEREHLKVCNRKRYPASKKHCARKIYDYLLKWRPERIEIYNKVSVEERRKLLITNPNQ